MRTILFMLWRVLRALPLLLVLPLLMVLSMLAMALSDLFARFSKAAQLPSNNRCKTTAASVVIPNWNGRDLLEQYLPSVVEALGGNPDNEIIVVENGSTDGSAQFLRERFPGVLVLALDQNLGFGEGSNTGFRAAKNDIVVLLNSDMRVDPGFLRPLLDAFEDEWVFAASCQIFFSDPAKIREETGLTQAWWEAGGLRVRHRVDEQVTSAFPCFYAGGGSSAFDRRKFLELGGFDHLLAPFYLEDTDLGYLAWKRGWKVLYEPRSIVFHEHRGTIGKRFERSQIERVLSKNFILFCWKNIHAWRMLWPHFFYLTAGAALSLIFGDAPGRANFGGILRAFRQLPGALRSRRRAQQLARITDDEAFRRPLGAWFRDRFAALPRAPEPLRVLFVSPYPICPPVHGGAVFMSQTARHLARLTELHLIIMLDHPWEREAHREMDARACSTEYLVRTENKQKQLASLSPHAVVEFSNRDLEWLIHRQVYTRNIDVIQIEYTALAQYGMALRRLGCILFEHDVYFQSVGRQLLQMPASGRKLKAAFEYLRALRFELGILDRFDRVQVCSPANGKYLTEFLPELSSRIDDDLRAGIDTSRYNFHLEPREPLTLLFLGSFRHTPNLVALNWFVEHVLPPLLEDCPEARLVVVGAEPPPRHSLPGLGAAVELRGFVEDVHEPLSRYAVFVCPILSGSGMRVKLLEAFASGIPVVSTRLGAEGLATEDGQVCKLADDPRLLKDHIVELFRNPQEARVMAARARRFVVENKDMTVMTGRLVQNYRAVIERKRAAAPGPSSVY